MSDTPLKPIAPSPSSALQNSFVRELLPVLALLGFTRDKPDDHERPGVVVECASRPYKHGWRIEAWLWCNAETFRDLHFQIAEIEVGEGSRGIALELPWQDSSKRELLEFAGNDFFARAQKETGAELGEADLERAVAFLAGAFAACSEQLVRELPELEESVRTAERDPLWIRARERAEALWRTRGVRKAG